MSHYMGKLTNYQRVKQNKSYSWPCIKNKNRTIQLFTDDVLRRTAPGVFAKITGICCVNILIPEEDIIEVTNDKRHLIMI